MRDSTIQESCEGALIVDTEYLTFVSLLIQAATASVGVVMFFARFEDEDSYPTDRIFDELVAAHNREVDVRVILDRDEEGQGINSRSINREAHDYLKARGVPVTFDGRDKYTHTKLVVVDASHVLIGSHNWTAGSFFNYDDTSVYLSSAALGEHYAQQVEALWSEYFVG